MTTKKIGDIIKTARKEKGMTQRKLSEWSLVSQGSISKVELGKRKLFMIDWYNICRALNLDPDKSYYNGKAMGHND